jgi:hypothetical protein
MNRFKLYRFIVGGIWVQVISKNIRWSKIKDIKDIYNFDDDFILEIEYYGKIEYKQANAIMNVLKKHKWYESKDYFENNTPNSSTPAQPTAEPDKA